MVARNSNFSATYTLSGKEESPAGRTRGSNVGSQHSTGGTGRVRGPSKTSIGGASPKNLPGSTPPTHKPRAASKETVDVGTHIVHQTSFSKGAGKRGGPVIRQQLRTGTPLSPTHLSNTTNSSTLTTGTTSSRPSSYRSSSRSGSRGIIVQQSASRSYYQDTNERSNEEVSVPGYNRLRLASIGASEPSSSSEDEKHTTQPLTNGTSTKYVNS